MEYELVGWPDDGVKLDLDHREFSYAGKFVMSNTGKAVAVETDFEVGDTATDGNQGTAGDGDAISDRRTDTTTHVDGIVDPDGRIMGAIAFNEDRTDPETIWLRYVTVRADYRGERIGPQLVSFTTARLRDHGAERVRIAVNNPFAYQALYRAGFAFTGEETGIAELVLEAPAGDRSQATYQAGLDRFRDRDLVDAENAFLDDKRNADPPDPIESPT